MFYSGNFMTNWLIRICLPWIRWQQQLLHTCTKPKWCITMKRSIPLIIRAPWPVCNLAKVDFQALVAIQPLECPVACLLAIRKNCLAVLLCLWWTITMGRNDYERALQNINKQLTNKIIKYQNIYNEEKCFKTKQSKNARRGNSMILFVVAAAAGLVKV